MGSAASVISAITRTPAIPPAMNDTTSHHAETIELLLNDSRRKPGARLAERKKTGAPRFVALRWWGRVGPRHLRPAACDAVSGSVPAPSIAFDAFRKPAELS